MLQTLFDNLFQRPKMGSSSGCDRARLLMLPYLAWVCFASALETACSTSNRS